MPTSPKPLRALPRILCASLLLFALTLPASPQQSEFDALASNIREILLVQINQKGLTADSKKKPPLLVFPLTSQQGYVTPFGVWAAQQITLALTPDNPELLIQDSTRMNPLVRGHKFHLEDLAAKELRGIMVGKSKALFAVGGTYEPAPDGVKLRLFVYRDAVRTSDKLVDATLSRTPAIEAMLTQPPVRQRAAHPAESPAPLCPDWKQSSGSLPPSAWIDPSALKRNQDSRRRGSPVRPGKVPVDCKTCPDPKYTKEARVANYSGTVTMDLLLTPQGNVSKLFVTRRAPFGLDYQAVDTVRKWQIPVARIAEEGFIGLCVNLEITFRIY